MSLVPFWARELKAGRLNVHQIAPLFHMKRNMREKNHHTCQDDLFLKETFLHFLHWISFWPYVSCAHMRFLNFVNKQLMLSLLKRNSTQKVNLVFMFVWLNIQNMHITCNISIYIVRKLWWTNAWATCHTGHTRKWQKEGEQKINMHPGGKKPDMTFLTTASCGPLPLARVFFSFFWPFEAENYDP